MDVFCLPSWREGMPRSIIEAMMMERAVIATNIRGSREEVIDDETGFLLPTRESNFPDKASSRITPSLFIDKERLSPLLARDHFVSFIREGIFIQPCSVRKYFLRSL